MSEDEVKNQDQEASSEEVLPPPVIEKITLTEINDELENQKLEEERAEKERIDAVFNEFFKAFGELTEQDVQELILELVDKDIN